MIRDISLVIEQPITACIGGSNPSSRDADATNFDRNQKGFHLAHFVKRYLQAG